MDSSSSSSQRPQRPSQTIRIPSPSAFLLSSPPAGAAPLTPNPASASSALAAGDYSDTDYLYFDEEEDDDSFSKPFHSPDGSTPSFPNPGRVVRGPSLSFGPPLSSYISPPTGGVPSASPPTSPTYLFPPPNTPFTLAHGASPSAAFGQPLGAFDNYGQPYGSYNNPGQHPIRSFSNYGPASSTPYSPGGLPPAPFSLGAPPQPRRPAQPNPSGTSSRHPTASGPPPPSSTSHPQGKEAGAGT